MTITHRIARQAAREVTLREAMSRDVAARNEETRERYRESATEVFPPRTAEEKAAVLDLHRSRIGEGRLDTVVRERYGVTLTQFRQVVVRLLWDEETVAARPIHTRRLRSAVTGRRDLRARAAARRAAGGAA